MNKHQVGFGLFTGAVVSLLGILVVLVSSAGWNLLLVGFGITVLASIAWHTHISTKREADSSSVLSGLNNSGLNNYAQEQ